MHNAVEAGQRLRAAKPFEDFLKGLNAALPIVVGYLPIAVTYGLLGLSSGLPGWAVIAMSVLVYAGASQFIAANLVALGASVPQIVLTTMVVNIRHLLMSASLATRVRQLRRAVAGLIAFGVTDETFVVAMTHAGGTKEEPAPRLTALFLLGLNLFAYLSWVGGTALGVFVADLLPVCLVSGLTVALYAMFISLLAPQVRALREVGLIAFLAAILNYVLGLFLPGSWPIVLATVAASSLGMWLPEPPAASGGSEAS
ncbi:MAG: AzlC family ABC transporter permease [Syntrophothermus sp.]